MCFGERDMAAVFLPKCQNTTVTMKEKETYRRHSDRLMGAALAGIMELLMLDLADNPPEDFTEEDIARHREAARKARESHNKLLGLTEKGGAQ